MNKLFNIILIILLTGCTNNMKPTDFKDQKPRLIIEDYLSGNVKAWGILENRSGKVTRQFSADLNGKWDGKKLRVPLEDDAIITERGVEWLYPINPRILIIK